MGLGSLRGKNGYRSSLLPTALVRTESKATGWSCSYWTSGRCSCTFRYWDDCSGFCPSWLEVLVLGSLSSRLQSKFTDTVLRKKPWTLNSNKKKDVFNKFTSWETVLSWHSITSQLKIGKCRLHSDCLLPGGEEQKWKDLSAKSSSASDSLQRRHVCSAAELPLSRLWLFILVRSLLLAAPFWCQDWKHCSARAQLQVCEVGAGRIHFCYVHPGFHLGKVSAGVAEICSNETAHVRKLALGKTGGKELRGFSRQQFVWAVVFLLTRRCLGSVCCWLSLLSLFLDAALWRVSSTVDPDLHVQVKPGCCSFGVW